MSDTVVLALIDKLGGIIAALGVILLGYWRFADRKKVDVATSDARAAAKAVVATAETVRVNANQVRATIEETNKAVAENTIALADVQQKTDGHFTAMEELLKKKSEELIAETAKVTRLMGALQEARGTTHRAEDTQ